MQILVVRNNGEHEFILPLQVSELREEAEAFEKRTKSLFFYSADSSIPEAIFNAQLDAFCIWMRARRKREVSGEVEVGQQWTTTDSSLQQP